MLNTPTTSGTKRRHERVRLRNLEALIAEAGSAAVLARLAGTSESYLSQVRRQLPTRKGTPRSVGDDLAEKLERAMGKPLGWLDESHEGGPGELARPRPPDAEAGPEIRGVYPLLSWVQAGSWSEIAGQFELGDAEVLLPCPVRCSRDTFVLRVRGESMEPRFHDGDLIFVDPHVPAISGRFVVVRLEDSQEATFKQLIVEDGRRYLKALNPHWPKPIIEIGESAVICGVVVFKGEVI